MNSKIHSGCIMYSTRMYIRYCSQCSSTIPLVPFCENKHLQAYCKTCEAQFYSCMSCPFYTHSKQVIKKHLSRLNHYVVFGKYTSAEERFNTWQAINDAGDRFKEGMTMAESIDKLYNFKFHSLLQNFQLMRTQLFQDKKNMFNSQVII